MATYRVMLNTKYKSKKGYKLGIRLIDRRNQKFYPLNEMLQEDQFESGYVKKNHPDHKRINALIDYEVARVKTYFAECTIKRIPIDIHLVFSEVKSHSFTGYLSHRAAQHKSAGQIEMYHKCDRFVREFTSIFGREEIYFSEITQDFLRIYDGKLIANGNVGNTRAKKFEFLGGYYNNAVQEGKAMAPNPFKLYKITTTPVRKHKLTKDQLSALEQLQLKPGLPRLARDIFLFSYYCKGIRFETCIAMKKESIANGRLHFQTNKGKKHMSAQIHPKVQAIIDRYIDNSTDTIFGRINTDDFTTPTRKRSIIGSENALMNRELKVAASLAGIPPISMHQARHTFAFHLKQHSDNIHVIKDSLGHAKSSTTENYLKELDDEYLDSQISGMYH